MYIFYKYRIYPNKEQYQFIQKTFGCVRFVYNAVLEYRKTQYKENNIKLSRYDCNNYKNQVLKKQYEWLNDVDKWALDNAVINMDKAYINFFNHKTPYPKFKSKHEHKQSYKTNFTNNNIIINFDKHYIDLPKLKHLKFRGDRKFNGTIKSAVILQVESGKYFVNILVDQDNKILPKNDNIIGIDLGVKHYITTSNGKKTDFNFDKYSNESKKIRRCHKRLSKKQFGSHNYEKQRVKLAKMTEHNKNHITNCLHNISKQIINENQVIILETLDLETMITKNKNRDLGKRINLYRFGEFIRQIKYKGEWTGRTIIQINQWYPSSQLCSVCGFRNENMKNLSIKTWTCPSCGTTHDRDINAAKNILQEGIRNLIKNKVGEI